MRTIAEAVSGADFPATKQDLIRRAFLNQAPQQMLIDLEKLPDIEFTSLQHIWEILGIKEETQTLRHVETTTQTDAYTYQTVDGALRQLHFPATKEQLLQEGKDIYFLGGKEDRKMNLGNILNTLEEEEYNKAEEIMNEINALVRKGVGEV